MTNLTDYARRVLETVVEPQRCDDGEVRLYSRSRDNGVRCDAAVKRATAILQELVDAVRAEPVREISAISGDGVTARIETLEQFNPLESFEATT